VSIEEFFDKLNSITMVQVPRERVLSWKMWMPMFLVNGFLHEYMVLRSMEDNLIFELESQCNATSQCTRCHLTVTRSSDRG
jgi:hypothetical protein